MLIRPNVRVGSKTGLLGRRLDVCFASMRHIADDRLHVRFVPILLKKSFLTNERFFWDPGALFMRRREGPRRFTQKRPQTAVSVLQSVAVAETTKNRHSRDFQGCSIFGFCNSICQQRS